MRIRIGDAAARICHGFRCLWLSDENMPDELRPDRSHVIFWVANASVLFVNVDADYAGAECKGKAAKFIEILTAKRHAMVIQTGHIRRLIGCAPHSTPALK